MVIKRSHLRKRKPHEIMRATDYAAPRISPKIGATSPGCAHHRSGHQQSFERAARRLRLPVWVRLDVRYRRHSATVLLCAEDQTGRTRLGRRAPLSNHQRFARHARQRKVVRRPRDCRISAAWALGHGHAGYPALIVRRKARSAQRKLRLVPTFY